MGSHGNMMVHDSATSLADINEQLECQLMALEDQQRHEVQDWQQYQASNKTNDDATEPVTVSQGVARPPAGPMEPASTSYEPKATDFWGQDEKPFQCAPGNGPAMAKASHQLLAPHCIVRAAMPSPRDTPADSTMPKAADPSAGLPTSKPASGSPTHSTSMEASAKPPSLGRSSKAKAKTTITKPAPSNERRVAGWRAKMAYFCCLYERCQFAKLDQLVQNMEANLFTPGNQKNGNATRRLGLVTEGPKNCKP